MHSLFLQAAQSADSFEYTLRSPIVIGAGFTLFGMFLNRIIDVLLDRMGRKEVVVDRLGEAQIKERMANLEDSSMFRKDILEESKRQRDDLSLFRQENLLLRQENQSNRRAWELEREKFMNRLEETDRERSMLVKRIDELESTIKMLRVRLEQYEKH